MVRYAMQRRASSAYGASNAAVGQASRHAVHVPQRSGNVAWARSAAVVSTSPMKKYEPRPGASRFVFLPIQPRPAAAARSRSSTALVSSEARESAPAASLRSEEHTSELQSHSDLVCRLLLEKKKKAPLR